MWFKRNDGVLMCADETSASFQMMLKSAEFTACDEEGNEISLEAEQSTLEDAGTQSNSGPSGAAVGSRTRKPNKAKSS